jgi:hypothetical protein
MGRREAVLYVETENSGRRRVRSLFADEVALALAMNKHALADDEKLREQTEMIRDASVAFINFATDLLDLYWQKVGASPGEPQPYPPPVAGPGDAS